MLFTDTKSANEVQEIELDEDGKAMVNKTK